MKLAADKKIFEFWFRKEYELNISEKCLKSFVRPEARLCPADKCTNIGDIVNLRILDVPGTLNSEPVLSPKVVPAVVEDIKVKKIHEMGPLDFNGSSEDASSIDSVVSQLERIYNRPFTGESVVTIFTIKYIWRW